MQVASHPMAGLDLLKGRLDRAADCRCVGQRGWRWQPGGGLSGLGTSPGRIWRVRCASTLRLGTGTADSSACVLTRLQNSMSSLLAPGSVRSRDAVIDVPRMRKRFHEAPDAFSIKPSAIADELWHLKLHRAALFRVAH